MPSKMDGVSDSEQTTRRASRAQAKGQHGSAATAGARPDLIPARRPARLSGASGDHSDQSQIRADANGKRRSIIECTSS